MTSGRLLTVSNDHSGFRLQNSWLGSGKDTVFIYVNLFNKTYLINKYILTFGHKQDTNPEKLDYLTFVAV